MGVEIERKFLVRDEAALFLFLKTARPINRKYIRQFYLSVNKEEEVRIRKVQDLNAYGLSHYLTIKSSGDLTRQETEVLINRETYNQLEAATLSNGSSSVNKERALVLYNGLSLEFDFFKNEEFNFIILEVEFKSVEEANLFDPTELPFKLEEVTTNSFYKNKNLWLSLNSHL